MLTRLCDCASEVAVDFSEDEALISVGLVPFSGIEGVEREVKLIVSFEPVGWVFTSDIQGAEELEVVLG